MASALSANPFETDPIDAAILEEGITDPKHIALVKSIYQQESSGGKNTKTSNRGAKGGMQVIDSTFKSVADPGWSNEGVDNLRAGIRYTGQRLKEANGDVRLAAAGYYGGPGGQAKAAKGIPTYDSVNKDAPNTLQYADQVAKRIGVVPVEVQKSTPQDLDDDPFAEGEPSAPAVKGKPIELDVSPFGDEKPAALPKATAAVAENVPAKKQSSYPGESIVDTLKSVPQGFANMIGSADEGIQDLIMGSHAPRTALPGAKALQAEAKERSPTASAIGTGIGEEVIPTVAGAGVGNLVGKVVSPAGSGLIRTGIGNYANAISSGVATGFMSPVSEGESRGDNTARGMIMGGVTAPLGTALNLGQKGIAALTNSDLVRKVARWGTKKATGLNYETLDKAGRAVKQVMKGTGKAAEEAAEPTVRDSIIKATQEQLSKTTLPKGAKAAFNRNLEEIVTRPGLDDDISKAVAARLKKGLAGSDKNSVSHMAELSKVLDEGGLTKTQRKAFDQLIDDHMSEASGGLSQITKHILETVGDDADKVEAALRKAVEARRISQAQADKIMAGMSGVSAGASGVYQGTQGD